MKFSNKTHIYALMIILVIIYGTATAYAVVRFDRWRTAESTKYLSMAKKEQNPDIKLRYAERAVLLRAGSDAYLTAGIAALEADNGPLAEKYLVSAKTSQTQLALGKAYLSQGKFIEAQSTFGKLLAEQGGVELGELLYLAGGEGVYPGVSRETNSAKRAVRVYDALIERGYPHAAILSLKNSVEQGASTRDSYIALGKWQMSKDKYVEAYDLLLKAGELDMYYPQVYQQLILICEKLGKVEDASRYRAFLSEINI